MNEFLEIIRLRRSIRQYINKAIPKDILFDIIDAGRLAPSANNVQPWEFVVVTNPEMLRQMAEKVTWGKFLATCAAAVVVCGENENPHIMEDCCAATENIILAAKSFNIGSCWMAGYKRNYSEEIKKILDIPKDMDVVSILSLGYCIAEPEMPAKRPIETVLHWEKY